jgi:hypothetical protein
MRAELQWCVGRLRIVRTVGDAAELLETEHGAAVAHSVAGQWEQSEWLGRLHDGIDPW